MNDYYVYIYYRLDTNEPFYVGKGHKNRWKIIDNRSKHFTNIINKHPVAVEIIKNNLTENEAFYWEEKIIKILVFEYGYSIDMPNNHSKEKGRHLVNKTWGGEGASRNWDERERKRRSKMFKGENNPNYGKHHSEETRQKISDNLKGKMKGEKNPFYGRQHTEETKNKTRGKNNYGAKAVICITTNVIFDTAKEGGDYYNCSPGTIGDCCKNKIYNKCKVLSAGKLEDGTPLVWMYLEDYEKANENEIQEKIKKAQIKGGSNAMKIFCITNNTIYNSIRHCAKCLKIDRRSLVKCCKGEKDFILIDEIRYEFRYL